MLLDTLSAICDAVGVAADFLAPYAKLLGAAGTILGVVWATAKFIVFPMRRIAQTLDAVFDHETGGLAKQVSDHEKKIVTQGRAIANQVQMLQDQAEKIEGLTQGW